jgi:two-component system phosphate regulon sensor histidine kinase PhoR
VKVGIRGKLFLASLALIVVSVAAADAYLTRALDSDLSRRVQSDLFVRLGLIARDASAYAAPLDDRTAWDALADDLARRAQGRVSVIRGDGVVLGDSELNAEGLARVENHSTRPEVKAAFAAGRGSSMRFSDTVRRRFLYVAVPFYRAGRAVGTVRLARPLTEVDEAIAHLRGLVLAASGVGLFVAVLMSSLAAHWMSRTVRELTLAAQRMAAGDLDSRTRLAGQDEVAELGRALDRVAGNLAAALGELRSERDLLSSVLQGMREGVLLLDRQGRVALANPALREMLLLGADVVGKSPLELIRNADLKRMIDQARTATEVVSGELELGDIKPRRLLVHASALPGEPGGLLAVFVDVTDLRRLETMRRDFVANVSHELRTPITAVRSAAETLRRAREAQPELADELIEIIERQAQRLQHLVEDLLDLARIESRQLRLNQEPVLLGPIVSHTLSLFREGAQARRIELAMELPEDLPPARVDRRALEQVLSNLVDNAVKYGSERGPVVIRASSQDGSVRISVSNAGPGIDAKHLPRLFERFYRVDAGRSREIGGTGLGLSIVKHLVEAMGGHVSVESAPDAGTTFAFTLPRADDQHPIQNDKATRPARDNQA